MTELINIYEIKMGAEVSDKDEECGVHAIPFVTMCISLWHFLVCVWPTWKRLFCCCK